MASTSNTNCIHGHTLASETSDGEVQSCANVSPQPLRGMSAQRLVGGNGAAGVRASES